MDVYQREDILEDHKIWLETDGEKGERANFERMALDFVNLSKADLRKANFQGASLIQTELREAKLQGANLIAADLTGANLKKAELQKAELNGARLNQANFEGSDLREAKIQHAGLVETNFKRANLTGCSVYGISVWNLKVNNQTIQSDLIITPRYEPVVTVDNIEVAQFIYLLLKNENIRSVIDTIGKKGVLIIGRFTEERKAILHAIRDELRNRYDYLPIMFEFDPLSTEPTIKTLSTLAHLSRFVIADLTDAKSILQELTKILHDLPTLPVQPIIHETAELPPMADSFLIMQSTLELYTYSTKVKLITDLPNKVLTPADDHAKKIESKLAEIRRKYLRWQNK